MTRRESLVSSGSLIGGSHLTNWASERNCKRQLGEGWRTWLTSECDIHHISFVRGRVFWRGFAVIKLHILHRLVAWRERCPR
jgi:hypothetical protein